MSNLLSCWGNYKKKLSLREKCCPCKGAPAFWSVNWIAALVHLINAGATLGLYAASDDSQQVFKLSENYAPWNPPVNGTCPSGAFKVSDEWCVSKESAETSELSLWWLVIVFHFLSFAFQALAMAEWNVECCKLRCTRKNYAKEVLEDGTNTLRMIEYAVSATLMQLAIALVLGVWERLVIIGIGFLTAVTMLQGLVAEKIKSVDKEAAWIAHLSGWVSMGGVWFILGRQFGFTIEMSKKNAEAAGTDPNLPPDFVYAIVVVIGVLYSGFGLVQLVDLCITKNSDSKARKASKNAAIEMAYCALSLTSKTFLGWIIFGNALSGMATNN